MTAPLPTLEILMSPKNYFEMADELVEIRTQLGQFAIATEGVVPMLFVVWELWISTSPSYLTLVSSLYKVCALLWRFARRWYLERQLAAWKSVVSRMGGPFIFTNDPTYQPFVYADGMLRVLGHLAWLAEKGAERAQ